MSPVESETDLRQRMQRIATKPRRKPAAKLKMVGTDGELPVETEDESVSPRSPYRKPAGTMRRAAPIPQSRILTLMEWGRWELTAVPVHRWNLLKTLLRGR